MTVVTQNYRLPPVLTTRKYWKTGESLVFKFQEWMVGSELWKKSISYREPIWIIHLENC